jgi:hypothetical protein
VLKQELLISGRLQVPSTQKRQKEGIGRASPATCLRATKWQLPRPSAFPTLPCFTGFAQKVDALTPQRSDHDWQTTEPHLKLWHLVSQQPRCPAYRQSIIDFLSGGYHSPVTRPRYAWDKSWQWLQISRSWPSNRCNHPFRSHRSNVSPISAEATFHPPVEA